MAVYRFSMMLLRWGCETVDTRTTRRPWEIEDGLWARQSHMHAVFDKSMSSTGAEFRGLTPLVLISARRQAGTRVYEPIHRFRLDIRRTRSAR